SSELFVKRNTMMINKSTSKKPCVKPKYNLRTCTEMMLNKTHQNIEMHYCEVLTNSSSVSVRASIVKLRKNAKEHLKQSCQLLKDDWLMKCMKARMRMIA